MTEETATKLKYLSLGGVPSHRTSSGDGVKSMVREALEPRLKHITRVNVEMAVTIYLSMEYEMSTHIKCLMQENRNQAIFF